MTIFNLTRLLTIGTLAVSAFSAAQIQPRPGPPPGAPPGPPPDLPPLLARAIKEGGPQRFSGERIVEMRRGPRRERHTEFIVRDGPRFRIDFPAGSDFSGQIIVENGQKRWHFFPDANEIQETPPRRDEAVMRVQGFIRRFAKGRVSFQEEQPQPVAGIRAVPFAIRDGAGNVFLRTWIDPKTGMTLKREFYDRVGTVVGFLEYVRIDYNPIIRPDDFRLRPAGATIVTPEMLARRLMKKAGMVEVFLPREFGLELEHARLLEGSEQPTLVQMYRGPKGPVSFYQVVGDIKPERLRPGREEDFRTYSWSQGGRTYVIVGDLTDEQLRQLARGVQLN